MAIGYWMFATRYALIVLKQILLRLIKKGCLNGQPFFIKNHFDQKLIRTPNWLLQRELLYTPSEILNLLAD